VNVQDLPYQNVPFDWFNNYYGTGSFAADFLPQKAHTFTYRGWDASKTRGCVCDAEWGDVDCSKHVCPYGTDVMDHRLNVNAAQKYQTQVVTLKPVGGVTLQVGNTFALTFKSRLNETFTTIPIAYFGHASSSDTGYDDLERDVKTALESLPNRVVDSVSVDATSDGTTTTTLTIQFTGDHVQGKQNLLTVRSYKCGDGCTPKLTGLELLPAVSGAAGTNVVKETVAADYNAYECGRRGKCNYDTGVCQCFAGYTGLACNTITALV